MKVERSVKFVRKSSFVNKVQYFIGMIIAILFALGFIPFFYLDVFPFLIVALAIQLVISILRLRIINVILICIMIVLSVASLIPIVGYLFRFLGFLTGLLDMASYKSTFVYKRIEKVRIDKGFGAEKSQRRKEKKDYKDAQFEEK